MAEEKKEEAATKKVTKKVTKKATKKVTKKTTKKVAETKKAKAVEAVADNVSSKKEEKRDKKKYSTRKRFARNLSNNKDVSLDKVYSLTSWSVLVKSSTKKIELIARLIRWKDIAEAIIILENLPHKVANILLKHLKNAIASATHNLDMNKEDLFIDRIDTGRAPKMKRIRYVARSRVHGYEKYQSFVRIVLNSKS